MTKKAAQSVLQRKMRAPGPANPADGPLTPSRALRLAFTRGAESASGLIVTVLGVTDEVLALDDLLGQIDKEQLLLAMDGSTGLLGLAAVDLQTRAAIIEMQTMGHLSAVAAPGRRATGTDVAMVRPVIAAFLAQLPRTCVGTQLAGWADEVCAGARITDLRSAGLMLADDAYRMVRLSLDLGVADRQGEVVLALLASRHPAQSPSPEIADDAWERRFQDAVLGAATNLRAVLARRRLTLREVEGFHVGQVLALPGTSVSSVRIEALDGRKIGDGRLGQVGGLRAVRLETRKPAQLREGLAAVSAPPPVELGVVARSVSPPGDDITLSAIASDAAISPDQASAI